jgi:flagellar basal-body rod modification protein FlgD
MSNNTISNLNFAPLKSISRDNIKDPTMPNKELTLQDEFARIKIAIITTIVESAKNQNPEDPMKSSEIAQAQTAMLSVEAQMKASESMIKAAEKMAPRSALIGALGLHGKTVGVDTSIMNFDGRNAVDYQYALDFQQENIPSGSTVSTKLTIYNSDGRAVYSCSGYTGSGKHKFSWPGKTSDGKIAPSGTYQLKVECNAKSNMLNKNGVYDSMSLRTCTESENVISSIELVNGEIMLMMQDGSTATLEQIKSVHNSPHNDSTRLDSPHMASSVATGDDNPVNYSSIASADNSHVNTSANTNNSTSNIIQNAVSDNNELTVEEYVDLDYRNSMVAVF